MKKTIKKTLVVENNNQALMELSMFVNAFATMFANPNLQISNETRVKAEETLKSLLDRVK